MSVAATLIADADEEPPEFAAALGAVYETLRDAEAPADAKRDAALQCWRLANHRTRQVEQRRQALVAGHGEWPHVGGLLLDCVAHADEEEVLWRCLRALVQLAYDNIHVSWLLLHNWVKEGRQLAKEEEAVYADLRDQIKKDVANVDAALRERASAKKDAIERMKKRPMGSAVLMSVLAEGRANISWRVKECAFHVANNIANSCWDGHDIILKDGAVQSACAEIDKDDAPFVVSAAVGFLCSLSYRPASRAAMLEQQVVPSLVPVIRKDSTEHNSMSAVLVAANVAGHLPQERCPAPKDLQLCAKAVAALQATLMRATFGGRYGTLWKVMMSVAALSDGAHNLPQLAANGVPGLVQQLLEEPHVNARAQEQACRCVLQLAFDDKARALAERDAPELHVTLLRLRQTGLTLRARAMAEAALWALGVPPPAAAADEEEWHGDEAGALPLRNNHVMIVHETGHYQHARCLAHGLDLRGFHVMLTGAEGVPNLTPGVRDSGVTLVLLSEGLQTSVGARAALLVAARTERPVVWLLAMEVVLPGPEGWLSTLPKHVAFGDAGPAQAVRIENLTYDAMTESLQPRETAKKKEDLLAEIVSRYVRPLTEHERNSIAARERAKQRLTSTPSQRPDSPSTHPKSPQQTNTTSSIPSPAGALPADDTTLRGSVAQASHVEHQNNALGAATVPLQTLLGFSVDQVCLQCVQGRLCQLGQ